jgi:protein TonB
MSLIRVGGFFIALSIHGLLLAMVPSKREPLSLSSGASNHEVITLSISYQPLQAVTPTISTMIKKPLAAEPLKQPAVDKVIMADLATKKLEVEQDDKIVNAPEQEPPPLQQLSETKPSIDEDATISYPTAIPVQSPNESGVQDTIITEPLFASVPVPPHYPQLARQRGQQGIVWVDVLLDKLGHQLRADIFQSSGVAPLDRAALDAVKRWQFIAHRINDITVASHIRIPVEFSLD